MSLNSSTTNSHDQKNAIAELEMTLEYLPVTKELKKVDSLNSDEWIEQTSQDIYNNPRFQLSSRMSCTIQKTKNEKYYVAFIRVSEKLEDTYKNSYYKAFARRDDYWEENNDPILFKGFREWIKEEESGRWVEKNKNDRGDENFSNENRNSPNN